jgi:hypothetical protein
MDQGLREVSDELQKEYGLEESIVKNVFASVNGGKAASFQVELLKNEDRGDSVIPMKEIETRWRERVGDIAGTRTLEFSLGVAGLALAVAAIAVVAVAISDDNKATSTSTTTTTTTS